MKFANMKGYSDVQAHEITRVVSAKCVVVRRIKATLLNGFNSGESDALTFHAGGFLGCTTGTQRYKYEIDASARLERIRLRKDGTWRDSVGRRFTLADEPQEFYDFNF